MIDAGPTTTSIEAPAVAGTEVPRLAHVQATPRAPLAAALACGFLYAVVTLVVAGRLGPRRVPAMEWVVAYVALAGFGLVVSLAWQRLARRDQPLFEVLRHAPAAALLQLAVTAAMAGFVEYKVVMQRVQPFWADALLERGDRLLHLGRHAYELIPFWPPLTAALDFVYMSWFVILFVGLTGWAWLGRGQDRARVFLAYFLCWALLGTIAATVLSSAGPVYAERLGVSAAFAPLTDYLGGLPLLVLESQEALWLGYTGEVAPGGISAMPSMHVAMPALFTLSVWRWRWLRIAGIAITGLMLAATVHLGWHYALDGYVAIALVIPIWLGAGAVVDALAPRTK